jgi:predicted kinase
MAAFLALAGGSGEEALSQVQFEQVRIGMARAVGTPVEIVQLRADVLERIWQVPPGLAGGLRQCGDAARPRDGCAVGNQPARHYYLGADSYANGAATLLNRGVFVLLSAGEDRALARDSAGEILLAAGASVRLADVNFPEIVVEIRAPRDKALPLGNLVSADVHRLVAQLARPSAPARNEAPRVMLAAAAPLPDLDQRTRAAVDAGGEGNREGVILYAASREPGRIIELPDLDQGTRAASLSSGEGLGQDVVLYAAAVPVPQETVLTPTAPTAQVDVYSVAETRKPASSELARLRAEVEAEIARDRERIAATLSSSCARPGAYQRGCAIATPPKRFAFAGA